MLTCPNCGTSVDGKFCVKCGLPVSAGSPGAQAPAGASTPGGYAPPQPAAPQAYQPQPGYQQQQPPQGGYPPPPAGGGYQQPGGGYQQPPPSSSGSGLEDNVAGALCYLFGVLSAVLFLVLEPYNKNPWIKFHAFQSLFLVLGMIPVWIVMMILSFILAFIPVVGGVVALLLYLGIGIGFLVVWIMLMVKAYQKQTWVLPVIGPLAQKQAYTNQ